MSTPGEEPHEQTPSTPGSYGEIAPGVPRYGQYAPAGWEPPQEIKDAQARLTSNSPLAPASKYPGFQGAQAGLGSDSGASLAPPNKVIVAIRMIMAAGVLQLLGLVVWAFAMTTPTGQELIRAAVEQSVANNPQALADAGVTEDQLFASAATLLAVMQGICVVLYFWIAAKLRRGRTWARTLALILAIISIALVPDGGSYTLYSGARIILGLVAVLILFRSPAKEFFLAHKARSKR